MEVLRWMRRTSGLSVMQTNAAPDPDAIKITAFVLLSVFVPCKREHLRASLIFLEGDSCSRKASLWEIKMSAGFDRI